MGKKKDRLSELLKSYYGEDYNVDCNAHQNIADAKVQGPSEMEGNVVSYNVTLNSDTRDVMVWKTFDGRIIAVDCNNDTSNAFTNAAIERYRRDTDVFDACGTALDFYQRFARKCIDEDDGYIFEVDAEEMIEELMTFIKGRTDDDDAVLDTIDRVMDLLRGTRKSDTYVTEKFLIENYDMNFNFRAVTVDALIRILTDSERDYSRAWIIQYYHDISRFELIKIYSELRSKKLHSSMDKEVMGEIIRRYGNYRDMAEALTEGKDFYKMESLARSEYGLGHRLLAKRIVECIYRSPYVSQHKRETAILSRDLGLPDSKHLFDESFLEEPSTKRFNDVRIAHPDDNLGPLIDIAWREKGGNPGYFTFFLTTGRKDGVAKLIIESDPDVLFDGCETDTMSNIAELLNDCGEYEASLKVSLNAIERTMSSGDTGIRDHLFGIVRTAATDDSLRAQCRRFRMGHDPDGKFWDDAGAPFEKD